MSLDSDQVLRESGRTEFRVALMGTPVSSGNRGVLALGASLVKLISHARPSAAISMLIPSRTAGPIQLRGDHGLESVDIVGYRLSPRAPITQQLWFILCLSIVYRFLPSITVRAWIARLCPWIRSVAQADFLGDIRGGDSFSDIYGTAQFIRGCLPVLSVIWIRNGIHLLPQTYGPFHSAVARVFARYILLRAESVWCRDRASLEQVSRLTDGRCSGALCPDVAFALEAVVPNSLSVCPALSRTGQETLIGVNVNGLVYHGGFNKANMFGLKLDYRDFLKGLLERLLSIPSTRVLLIPHTFAAEGRIESDPAASRDLMRSLSPELSGRVHLVNSEYDPHELKAVIGMCDFFIGSRMHACIAALSQGIPTLAVAYSRKFEGVFDTVGVANWVIDGRTNDTNEAIRRAVDLFSQRHASRAAVADRVAAAQTELSQVFDHILEAPCPPIRKSLRMTWRRAQ